MEKIVYLDNNATTKIDEKVLDCMLPYFKDKYANPSSMYDSAHVCANAIEESRKKIADFLGIENEKNILFTSCGTESANTAIKGVVNQYGNLETKNHIITTQVEHPCVLSVYENYEKNGYKTTYVSVDENGELNIENLLSKITPETILLSVMHANNETGAIYPVYEIAQEAKKINKNLKVFVDGVQAAGKIPVDLNTWDPDSFSVSGHKLGAMRGTGLIYVKNNPENFLKGGEQESGFRPGTENVAGAYSLALALEKHMNNMEEFSLGKQLAGEFITGLKKIKGALIIPENREQESCEYSPWIIQAAFASIPGEVMVRSLAEKGICISTGSACSSKKNSRPVLLAMGIPPETARNGVRFSFGPATKREEILLTLEALKEITARFN